jgi:uncharacterized OsmC-like protein
MGEADIASAIANARSYLTANPADARYRDSAATATVEDGLRVRVSGADGSALVTDMVAGVGGGGSAPSPGWMLRAAYASCVATFIAMQAAEEGWRLSTLTVTVDSESDDRGVLGISPDVPAGPLSVRVAVDVSVPGVDPEVVRTTIETAISRCPVHDAVVRPVPVEVEIRAS